MITYDFSNRIAVVTGGTRGIGAAVTTALLKAGASVYALYASNDQAANAFVDKLAEYKGKLFTIKCDVGNYSAVEAFFNSFDQENDHLDILVNCAGIRMDGVVAMLPKENWDKVINVNLNGSFTMFKLASQRMLRKRWGRIIGITSPSGRIGIEGQANYAASKAGQVAMMKSMSKEVAKRHITVNCVSPGFIDTEFISGLPEEQATAYKNSVPLKRFGTPQDVANAVLFLASEESEYITGTVLEVSGGI